MKLTMVIPTYWGREKDIGWQPGDAVYDHPTPLDEEGTLVRAIESLNILNDKEFELVIIAAATSQDIEETVENKVKELVKKAKSPVKTYVFTHSDLEKVKNKLPESELSYLLQLRGYSNIRNLCLFLPHILSSDVALLIDDDEVFEDPFFIEKAKEFIGKEYKGEKILAVAGYYLQEDNEYLLSKEFKPYMFYWNKFESMNEGFRKIIGEEPRLKKTPFVFGGNMVIHRELFMKVPFDPDVTRGEDIDYLMNAKMFGYEFYLDNKLAIKHLPPPKPHPTWRRVREDILRFVYEREKIRKQKEVEGMVKIKPEDFDPYPGVFLKNDLEDKIAKASELLALEYLAEGNPEDAKETLNNIKIIKESAIPRKDPFENLLKIQKDWEKLMKITDDMEVKKSLIEEFLRE